MAAYAWPELEFESLGPKLVPAQSNGFGDTATTNSTSFSISIIMPEPEERRDTADCEVWWS